MKVNVTYNFTEYSRKLISGTEKPATYDECRLFIILAIENLLTGRGDEYSPGTKAADKPKPAFDFEILRGKCWTE